MSIEYPQDFLNLLQSVEAKRPKTVIQHILKHGFITSQELTDIYGYNHPPRAIRDVRELNIPIETYRVEGRDGRKIAAYKFGNPTMAGNILSKNLERTVLSKTLKQQLIQEAGAKCFIYFENMDEAILQVDHRIPYEIAGEQPEEDLSNYMLLSPSANRAKSWACEHCSNWLSKSVDMCKTCFWACPENYTHISGKDERTVSLMFTGNDIKDYEKLVEISSPLSVSQNDSFPKSTNIPYELIRI